MIQNNNNLSVLPWYSDEMYQNHRKSYAYGQIYPLFTPNGFILPFQIIRPTRANQITAINLRDRNGNVVMNMLEWMNQTGLQIVRFASLGYDVIVYPGNLPFPQKFNEGIYYLAMNDGVQRYVSDMFTIVNDVSGYLKIEWFDAENMVFDAGTIVYQAPKFRNVLYLCTQLGKPEYPFEEEGENRDGYFFPEKQISEKTYRFICLAPEYLCDAMRLIRMSDYVIVTSHGLSYECDTFLITPKWQTQGDLASVECEFETATVVKKIGRGYIMQNKGDFNNDYNNDFNNQ